MMRAKDLIHLPLIAISISSWRLKTVCRGLQYSRSNKFVKKKLHETVVLCASIGYKTTKLSRWEDPPSKNIKRRCHLFLLCHISRFSSVFSLSLSSFLRSCSTFRGTKWREPISSIRILKFHLSAFHKKCSVRLCTFADMETLKSWINQWFKFFGHSRLAQYTCELMTQHKTEKEGERER